MSKIIMLRAASSRRRQPLLQGSRGGSVNAGTQLGEAVGGAAAVFCCCPCGLANILFLTVYKLPVSLCRRALQNKKRLQRNQQRLAENKEAMVGRPARRRIGCNYGCEDIMGAKVHPKNCDDELVNEVKVEELKEKEEDKDVMELEKEMWEIFYNTGFWRSCSKRQNSSSSSFSLSTSSSLSLSSPQGMIM